MKKLLLLFAVLANALSASAYDFEVNGIAYNKLSGNTCEVTMKDNNFDYSDDIIIPSSVMHAGVNYTVTAIGTSAFANSGITSISIPTTVTKIGSNAFGRTNITYITLPDGLTEIADGLVLYCSNLTTVNIPKSVKAIGLCAFGACKNLFKLVLPENVERLDAQVFAQCTNLSTMVSLNTTPPTVKIDKSAKGYEDTFMQFDKKSCTLKVPAEAVEAYKAAEGWSEFKIVALTEEEKIALSLSSPIANTGLNGKAFNLQGVEVGDSYRGIVIKGGKKIVRK